MVQFCDFLNQFVNQLFPNNPNANWTYGQNIKNHDTPPLMDNGVCRAVPGFAGTAKYLAGHEKTLVIIIIIILILPHALI